VYRRAAPVAGDAEPVVDEGPGPEPVQEPELWDEPENGLKKEPAQQPEPKPEEEFEEEPAEELAEEPVQEPEDEPEEEPEEEPGDVLQEELPDEPEEGPEPVTEKPGPAAIPPHSRVGPVDELLLGLEPEEPTGPVLKKRAAGSATTTSKKAGAETTPTQRKPGSSKKTLLIIGLIAALLVIAIALVALLPMLTGFGLPGINAPAVQPTPVATATPVVTTVPTPSPTPVETAPSAPALAVPAATPVAAETPEQVDILPPQYTLHFEVFKDVVTGDVTVSVTGPSRNVVKDIEVTVFHPDGTTDSDHLLPSQGMTEVTVTGTRSAERVVVTVLFYSGEQYTLIDRTVSFSRRT
jgi:hypothetical protein